MKLLREDYPSWTLEMQIMTSEQAENYWFDIRDVTKIWPNGDFPPIKIDKLVLNRNPIHYFAQVVQTAFSPANLVPGIGIILIQECFRQGYFLITMPTTTSTPIPADPFEYAKEFS